MKVGIDLGGSHIAIGVVDSRGVIIEKMKKEFYQVIYLFLKVMRIERI